MSTVVPVRTLLVALAFLLMGSQCGEGTFDGGIPFDGGASVEITAADIGTLCTYVDGSGENPSNTCPRQGMECLIRTADGAYAPRAPGVQPVFQKSSWEDQTSIYRQAPNGQGQFIDEGYCTIMGTWQAPPACPIGTELKLYAGNLAVCLANCQVSGDCARSGYVCDRRYLDTGGSTCVRACEFDVPDCIRSGVLVTKANPEQIETFLTFQDFQGGSFCELSSGLCLNNDQIGTNPPGSPCDDTRDCIDEQVCFQNNMLGTPPGTKGMCAFVCKPDPAMPLVGCPTGYACQAGFQFGHTPFALKDIVTGDDLEAGGVCLPECASSATACDSFPGTTCASADPNVFAQPWNQVSMCLLPALAN